MSFTIKNDKLLLKDGLIAEGCGCCADVCDLQPGYLTMTVYGLPNALTGHLNVGYAARSPFDDNGAAYTMYKALPRYAGDNVSCQWRGGPHGHINRVGRWYEDWAWHLDAAADKLYGYGFVFSPPDGASFRNLPYEDQRPLVASVYGSGTEHFGDVSGWSNVVVMIEQGASGAVQWQCPTLPSICNGSSVPSGIYTPCPATTQSANAVQDLSVAIAISGDFTEYRTVGLPGVGTTSWGPIANIGALQGSLSCLSGDYDLAWKNFSGIGPGGLTIPGAYNAPDGWELVSQGYSLVYAPVDNDCSLYITNVGGALIGLGVAIRPTAFKWDVGSSPSRCGDGNVSWGVNVFIGQGQGSLSPCGAFFTSVACTSYSCGSPPSLSVSSPVEVIVRLCADCFGPWIELRGAFDISLST